MQQRRACARRRPRAVVTIEPHAFVSFELDEHGQALVGGRRRWSIFLPGHPPSINARMHWRTRNANTIAVRKQVQTALDGAPIGKPIERARVTLYLRYTSTHVCDIDNAYTKAKPVLDALIRSGLLRDDAPKHMELQVVQEKSASRHVKIVVEEVRDEQ